MPQGEAVFVVLLFTMLLTFDFVLAAVEFSRFEMGNFDGRHCHLCVLHLSVCVDVA